MSGHDEQLPTGTEYPVAQMARAFVTALGHEDAAARERAEHRLARWREVFSGIADGRLSVGSGTPVAGLPRWVTLEVVRGGFATGEASAGGPLLPHETDVAARAAIPPDRRAVFLHYLTGAGLAELGGMLDSGRYEVTVPEESALLVVAWLLRAGDRVAALDLLETLEPFAGRLRFGPRPAGAPVPDPDLVCRRTAGQAREELAGRKPNLAVAAMREALLVWGPFGDELLALWLETVQDARVASVLPGGWADRGAALLERYRALAASHPHCSKHRRPKENIAILRAALEEVVAGRPLQPRRRGLLQHAVDSMVARRGTPGAGRHARLRERQLADAARPTHHALAQLLAGRLSVLPQAAGVPDVDPVTGPVTAAEEAATGVPAQTTLPPRLRRVAARALAAPAGSLLERGVIPSAEVLAELVPQIVAEAAAAGYADEALRTLMAVHYRAFAARRSLLLRNLDHQTGVGDLPWVQAVARHRDAGTAAEPARQALNRLATLAVTGFPATILPNPMLKELSTLARAAGLEVPFTSELAADIFVGAFSAKFLGAAQLAAGLLGGTLYERYYGIDYRAVLKINDVVASPRAPAATSGAFAALCRARSGVHTSGYSVAANGMVIEQAQILTTHNLAALVSKAGVHPAAGWPALARQAFATMCGILARLDSGNARPLSTIKDAAYAWRQTLFFLALASQDEIRRFTVWADEQALGQPGHVTQRLDPVLAGLRHVAAGGSLDGKAVPGGARRFLGWSQRGHWMATLPATVR